MIFTSLLAFLQCIYSVLPWSHIITFSEFSTWISAFSLSFGEWLWSFWFRNRNRVRINSYLLLLLCSDLFSKAFIVILRISKVSLPSPQVTIVVSPKVFLIKLISSTTWVFDANISALLIGIDSAWQRHIVIELIVSAIWLSAFSLGTYKYDCFCSIFRLSLDFGYHHWIRSGDGNSWKRSWFRCSCIKSR